MVEKIRIGAVGALLDEYERAILQLLKVIQTLPQSNLIETVNPTTSDKNCQSIQTILTHVLYAGYGYACSIQNRNMVSIERPPKEDYLTGEEYCLAMQEMFLFTENIFANITDDQLEELDQSLKIKTGWNQLYDVEQLTEHAIVHILRHRRQIEKIIKQNNL